MTDLELESVKRAKDRIRDLIWDHILDLEGRLAGCKAFGDPLGISGMLAVDIEECKSAIDRSGLGIFEHLEVMMDLIEAKGI